MDPNTRNLQQLDAAYHLHPFNDNAALAKRGTRILTRARVATSGMARATSLLDAFAGLWCVNIGYGRTELGAAAARQMTQLAYYNSFFSCTTEPTVRLAAKLAELSPGDLNHAFFSNSGSEANDTILRMVRHFWAVQDQPAKNIVIGRHNGYHGSHRGRRQPRRHEGHAQAGRAADSRHPPHRPAILVYRWRRALARRNTAWSRRVAWRPRFSNLARNALPPLLASRSWVRSACISRR